MKRSIRVLAISAALALSGCGFGTYTPGLHHGSDSAMTGSHLQSVDTGSSNDASDPSLRQVQSGTGGGH